MATYGPITKTLKKAVPLIRTSDNVVKQWEIEVVYSYAGDETTDPVQPAWKTTYSESEDVEYMNKTADQFTKAELIGFMNPIMETAIFPAHYEASGWKPAEEDRVNDFDIDSLS